MANICHFRIEINCKEGNIDKFMLSLTHRNPNHELYIGGGADAVIENSLIIGQCKWSVKRSLIESTNFNIFDACKYYGINKIEIYSWTEPTIIIHEHYLYENASGTGMIEFYEEDIVDDNIIQHSVGQEKYIIRDRKLQSVTQIMRCQLWTGIFFYLLRNTAF